MPNLLLDSSVNLSTAAAFSANLAAGTHTLLYGNGVADNDTVTFSVDNSGAVYYDPSLNNVLSGRGGSTLTVKGVTVKIDAHALTMPVLNLNFGSGETNFATATPFSATLLPGVQSLLPVNGGPVAFTVSNSDTVDYDPSLNGVLSGRSSSTLVVKGPSTTAVTSSLTSSVFGQDVTFTATVGAVALGAGTPTVPVTFLDGTSTLGTGTLNSSGQATLTVARLLGDTHTITAIYAGDAHFTASTSGALTVTVISSQQELSLIINQVTAMVSAGILDSGNGNALIVKLNAAITSLNSGNTITGDNQMDSFINQTNAFLKSGKLDSTDALTLIKDKRTNNIAESHLSITAV